MSDFTIYPQPNGKFLYIAKTFILMFCFIISFQIFITDEAHSQWVWQNPLPVANTLQDVGFFDANNILAVGQGGIAIKSTDGGITWTYSYAVNDPAFYFTYVSVAGANTAFATSSTLGAPTPMLGILKTTDRGTTWTNVYNASNIMTGIDFLDENTGYSVGYNMSGAVLLKTTNGGTNWVSQLIPASLVLLAVDFLNVNTGFAAGPFGTIFKTTNGGDNWFTQSNGTNKSDEFWDIHFIDINTGIVVGAGGVIFKTTNGGNNWTSVVVPGIETATLQKVYFANANNGTIVGTNGILTSTDAGNTWTPNTPLGNELLGLDFIGNTGMAVGSNGTVIKTTDGGQNWAYTSYSVTSVELRSSFFASKNNGVAVGLNGTIVKTTNSGQNWISVPSGTTNFLHGVFFSTMNTGWAVGISGTIIKTTDGGNTWSPQVSGVGSQLNDVFFTDINTGTISGHAGVILRTTNGGDNWFAQTSGASQNMLDVFFMNSNTGIVVGASGRILRTTNGGDNWAIQTNGSAAYNGVFFVDANTGTSVGAGGRVVRTTNSGLNWTVQTSGTTAALNGVFFSNANTGIAVGASGTMIKTTNGGTNWVAQTSGATITLNDIFFTDANNATVVGQFGTILRVQSPSTNSNYGNNGQSADNQYFFANSTPASGGAPSQPQFIWRDTTGSIDLYVNGTNQAPGIFTGTNDDGRWNLLAQLAGGNVRFFGSDYSNVYVGTNGIIGLNAFNVAANQPPFIGLNQPDVTEAIFPLWTDMNIDYAGVAGRRVSYKVTATEIIVTYDRIPVYAFASQTNDPNRYISFQVIIKFNNLTPTQNSQLFLSYNYDQTGSVFINEYNEGTLRPHLVGLQKNNDTQQFFQYRFRNALTLATDGPIFGSNMTLATGPDANVLPVELTSFTSMAVKNEVILDWATAFEINNAGFDIERAQIWQTGDVYHKIGSVQGNGSSQNANQYKFTDRNVQAGKYKYRLKQIDFNGNYEYHNLSNEVIVGVPAKFDLSQNYPNPFNPVTKINFDIPVDSKVTLKIFDITGREVATLINEIRPAGYHTVTFDAQNFSSGIYFYKVIAGANQQFTMTKKMMVIK